jgi:type IV pilus assembly protein PilA
MGAGGQHVRSREEGFTLIELMVVVLIIAVLLGIAIPTFLGTRRTANDRAVESNVRNAFTAARVFYNEKLEYSADPSEMRGIEPSIGWTNAPLDGSQPATSVYIEVQDYPTESQTVVVVGRSKSGKCFYMRDIMAGLDAGTHYQASVPGGANCSVPLIDDPDWADSWIS